MPTEADPILRGWYRHLDKGQEFRVVAVDEGSGTVEVQDFDGDLEEISLEDWYTLNIEPIEPPESWSGPADVTETDDLGESVTDTQRQDWDEPSRQFRRPGEVPGEPAEAPGDDWAEGYPEEEPSRGEEG